MSDAPIEVSFRHVRTPNYRTHHVDGAQCTLTPDGHFCLTVWAEHPSFPVEERRQLTSDGRLGDRVEAPREGSIVIERELEASLFMTRATAEAVVALLNRQLSQVEKPKQSDEDSAG